MALSLWVFEGPIFFSCFVLPLVFFFSHAGGGFALEETSSKAFAEEEKLFLISSPCRRFWFFDGVGDFCSRVLLGGLFGLVFLRVGALCSEDFIFAFGACAALSAAGVARFFAAARTGAAVLFLFGAGEYGAVSLSSSTQNN